MTDYVNFKIGSKDYSLKITADATKAISNAAGGLLPALYRVKNFDFEFYSLVIAAGSGKHNFGLGLEMDRIQKELAAAGLPDLVEPLCDYISRLANGGKPIELEGIKQ